MNDPLSNPLNAHYAHDKTIDPTNEIITCNCGVQWPITMTYDPDDPEVATIEVREWLH